ncbi:MAG: serine hydrolase domain-containing protein [Bacteroidia bacterium]|nr:serine hydrolase domain-containing protein [Bacteroidia bacterium]
MSQPADTVLLGLLSAKLKPTGKRPVHAIQAYIAQNDRVARLAVGFADGDTVRAHPDDQFKVASITKTMTAVVILQLAEEGALELEAPVAFYLKAVPFVRIQDIHRYNDTLYGDQVTVLQLLNHRSGIADLFDDAAVRFYLSVYLHKQRSWSPEKLFARFYKYNLPKKAHFKPGEGYRYSDTNYFLLGLLAETVTGKQLPELFRERIYTPLQLNATYFEYYEPAQPNGHTTHQFLWRVNATHKLNTSYDWAGGGVVSTCNDLARFLEGLFANQLFRKPETLARMLADTPHSFPNGKTSNYGLGITRYTYNETVFYGHSGFWGSQVMYSPEKKLVFCANINQANPVKTFNSRQLISDLLRAFEAEQ